MITTPYQTLHKSESFGGFGTFGLNIEVAGSMLPDLKRDDIYNVVYKAAKDIEAVVRAAAIADDPSAQKRAAQERADLLSLFPAPIHVTAIPNGYCSDWCCKHLPWFVVTTTVGPIKIGWRKRVIEIDWSASDVRATAEELFAAEDVTKGERDIHAWSLEKAAEYVAAIMAEK